ncbi:MAG TPA: ATP-binding protein [Candidatus Pacearchaeota archaeon]|nr:ATP-binding protein [Candidatus Pacearchaeota archaeon]
MYKRILQNEIEKKLFKGKVIIIVGARQTGKTTLSFEILSNFDSKIKQFNCDNPMDRDLLSNRDLEFLKSLIGDAKIVFIDEGQKVENLGQTLKLLVDNYKEKKQIIVTGSSSFNILDMTQEPLTGRKFVFNLFPLSLEEIYPEKDSLLMLKELEPLLIFGSYPEVEIKKSLEEKEEAIREISESYLYKDVFEFQRIKKSAILDNLLKALALQIGGEVSYRDLANIVGIDKKTVENYIDILEKNYIIFRLYPYAQNKRKVISKLRKVYFWDLGIRNSIINNFNFLNCRNDVGALWENFCIVERLKYQSYHKIHSNNYFWRTYEGAEVDLIEEREGSLYAYEFKWNDGKKIREPLFTKEYKNSSFSLISPKNLGGFVW